MAGKGWDLTCEGGDGTQVLLAALAAVDPSYLVRVEWDDEDGDERIGDYRVQVAADGTVLLTPFTDEGEDAGPTVHLFVGDIRSMTIY